MTRPSAALSVALVLGLTIPSAAQYFDKVGGKRRVLAAVGKEAVDCGTFAGDPYSSARSLTSQQERAVSACATKALNEHRAWYFAVEASAVDSWVATGLMGGRDGGVQVFWYDSAPCGGPQCGESFKAYDCAAPWTNGVIRPLMACGDSKMPQPQRAGRPTTR
jgi:hypothetical protein